MSCKHGNSNEAACAMCAEEDAVWELLAEANRKSDATAQQMAARIAALEAAIAEQKEISAILRKRIATHEDDNARITSEREEALSLAHSRALVIERLTADAERWRHLERRHEVLLLTGFFGNGCVNKTLDDVRAAIDQARKEEA